MAIRIIAIILPHTSLTHNPVNRFQDIQFIKQSLLDASGEFSGDIHIQGRNVTFTDGSLASIVNIERLNPGAIHIDATETLDMTGITSFNIQPSLGTLKILRGLNTTNISGKGADIIISAKNIIGQGSEVISPVAVGLGISGDLIINATESVEILGGAINETSGIGSIFGTITYGAGKAGDVNLSTQSLQIAQGGTLESLTFGSGRAGKVTVNASEFLKISGGQAFQLVLQRTKDGSPDVANAIPGFLPSSIISQSFSSGNAGDIAINTPQLTIDNGGKIAASALVSGVSGNIKVNATNTVNIEGSGSVNQSLNHSTITSSVGTVDPYLNFIYNIRQVPTAATGSVEINTRNLSLKDGGQVTVQNDGIGKAGELQINADSVNLENQAGIIASSRSGEGGNIKINSDNLVMRHNSEITTNAGSAVSKGDGGQIKIMTTFLVAPPLENSDITANAFEGRGGNINITAQGIFGIESRSRLTPLSDITASSTLGINGTVQINSLETQTVPATRFPENIVQVPQITSTCQANSNAGVSTFVNTGTGGIPYNPDNFLSSSNAGWYDRSTVSQTENTLKESLPTAPIQLVEAQNWRQNPDGTIVLIAESTGAIPSSDLANNGCSQTAVTEVQDTVKNHTFK